MAKSNKAAQPVAFEPEEPVLKKQSRWSCEPWKPGEIPAGMIFVTKPEGKSQAPWCREKNGVGAPSDGGKRHPYGAGEK